MGECAAHLLEQHRLLEEAQARATVLLGYRDAGPAELGQLEPRGRGMRLEVRARLRTELLLLGREGEVHYRLLPAVTTSATSGGRARARR